MRELSNTFSAVSATHPGVDVDVGKVPPVSPGDAAWVLDAFGLSIRSDCPMVGAIPEADGAGNPGPRSVRISQLQCDPPAVRGGATVLERLHGDRSLGMRVVRLDDGSYVVDAPGHGWFWIADDGLVVRYHRPGPSWRWHRPLYAQVLPLAATLQGFELFHASAVALEGRAVAVVAESGTGKTSLAVALLARGAELITDDVLALESTDGGIVAHPGVPFGNIAADQLALLCTSARARVGVPIGTSDKVHVEIANMSAEPLALGAVYFLRRSRDIQTIAFERASPPEPRDLLGATFMPHVVNQARLITQLTTCAEIARSVAVFKLSAPASLTAAELGAEVERHISGTWWRDSE
jgi:hypothetical protein